MTALELAICIGQTEERFAETVFSPPAKKTRSRPIRTALILGSIRLPGTIFIPAAASAFSTFSQTPSSSPFFFSSLANLQSVFESGTCSSKKLIPVNLQKA